MEVIAHISNGRIEDVAMETPNCLMEGESTLMSQMEWAPNFTPPNSYKVNNSFYGQIGAIFMGVLRSLV